MNIFFVNYCLFLNYTYTLKYLHNKIIFHCKLKVSITESKKHSLGHYLPLRIEALLILTVTLVFFCVCVPLGFKFRALGLLRLRHTHRVFIFDCFFTLLVFWLDLMFFPSCLTCWDGVSINFCQDWPWTTILLISTFPVAGIIRMSHLV